jgi:anti-anti-sigma factor
MSNAAIAKPVNVGAQRSTSLRRQILLGFSLTLATALVAVSAAMIVFVLRGEEQSWRERQTERARAAETVVTGFLDQTRATLTLAGALPARDVTDSPELLRTILQQHPELLEIVRLDARGALVAMAAQQSAVLANLFTVAQSVWFREAAAGTPYLSDVQLSAQSEPYLIVATPAADGGVVAARLRLTVLESLVGAVGFGVAGQTYVVNQAGQVIAHPDSQLVLANTSLGGRPELDLTPLADGVMGARRYINIQGQSVFGVTTALPASDWLLINEVSELAATALSRTALSVFGLGMLLFGLLLLGVGAVGLDRLILRPIERLRAGAAQIARGDRDYRLAVARRDEVGQVAEAFNEMAQAIQAREQDLERLAASLEQTVSSRTAELRREVDERARLQEETERQAFVLRAMSTPVIPINEQTLVMPLIGALDSSRIVQIRETLLQAIERSNTRVAILDVTGVPVIDSQMAGALIATSQAVRLLGAVAVLTGIRPEIAQSLVALGVDLTTLVTRSTLQSGIAYALSHA